MNKKNDRYSLLLDEIKMIIKDGIYCEDDELFLQNNIKYKLYNLIIELDKKFIDEVWIDIEYKG